MNAGTLLGVKSKANEGSCSLSRFLPSPKGLTSGWQAPCASPSPPPCPFIQSTQGSVVHQGPRREAGTSGHRPSTRGLGRTTEEAAGLLTELLGLPAGLRGPQDGALDWPTHPCLSLASVCSGSQGRRPCHAPLARARASVPHRPSTSQGVWEREVAVWVASIPPCSNPSQTRVSSKAKVLDSLQLPVANSPLKAPDRPPGQPKDHFQGQQPWLTHAGFRNLQRGCLVGVRGHYTPGSIHLGPEAPVMCLCCEASPTLGPAPSCWVPRALASSSPSSANLRPPGWHRAFRPLQSLDRWTLGACRSLSYLAPPYCHSHLLAPSNFCPNLPRPAFLSSP